MNKELSGKVVKCLSNRFIVDTFVGKITAYSRKALKRNTDILVGDNVTLSVFHDDYVISGRERRKNSLVRPPIVNTDMIIITVAPKPQVDFYLIDKLLVNAVKQDMQTVLCLNKVDLDFTQLYNEILTQYDGLVDKVVRVSAKNNELDELKEVIYGKQCCFAGQSAVGKSSLVNAITGLSRETGALSEKSQRGKNTTTDVELIKIDENTYVADSPGFSMLDVHDVAYDELNHYYADFNEYAFGCKFRSCTHVNEPNCAVIDAVKSGKLNAKRYERYVAIHDELKKQNDFKK